MTQFKYILIAGVSGAGKSSLYSLQPRTVKGTRRINKAAMELCQN